MTHLTLPGTIPGLLRRCSPVYVPPVAGSPSLSWGSTGIVTRLPDRGSDSESWPAPGHCLVSWTGDDGGTPPDETPLARVGLSLEGATGRMHGAWWALEHTTSPAVQRALLDLCRLDLPANAGIRNAAWRLLHRFCLYTGSLAPDDPSTLADGSRRVDAEVLRLVVLHVAGLEVTA